MSPPAVAATAAAAAPFATSGRSTPGPASTSATAVKSRLGPTAGGRSGRQRLPATDESCSDPERPTS